MPSPSSELIRGVAAGVPFIAAPPLRARSDAPVVVLWHLLDPPRSPQALAAALPLDGVDAWRVYLELPLTGARLPAGGWPEVVRLAGEEPVLNVHWPIMSQAAAELPAVLGELGRTLAWTGRPRLALLGGSAGAAVAQRSAIDVLPHTDFEVDALVLVSPVCQLRATVSALAKRFKVDYRWQDEAANIAARLDFVARARELAAAGRPAVRLIVGADDDHAGFIEPATRLRDALRAEYDDPARVELTSIVGMGHALAEEPGFEAAPQTRHAAEVDRLATEWLRRFLRGCQ